jgi:hypothetical protein
MIIPIISTKLNGIIGNLLVENNELWVRLLPGHEMTHDEVFDTFGNCGFTYTHVVDVSEDPEVQDLRIADLQITNYYFGPMKPAPEAFPVEQRGDT